MIVEVPSTWMGRMKAQAMRAGDRLAPMAGQARQVASSRLEDARHWAAPRLEEAAHRVEEEFAPRVSEMLTRAAKRVDPTPARTRRWPVAVLMTGIALGAMGYMFYRRNAQQWTDQMKDSAADASRWVSEKADRAADQASSVADEASKK
ncbi:YtxH domain-containing protein [Thermoactinospora rubra]|uniref:YtxH domain-containing protein n=1 Tax=Thermoactinospora rubra TaxID=1088767 RepID=UPI00117BE2F3|nr:YtxH domain-containing protein [Thermoactinospora rubra]